MKRALAILTLFLLTLTCQAQGFFRGAYWCTKAPEPGLRYAGALEMVFFDDLTMEADVYAGGSYLMTATAGYAETTKTLNFSFVDSDGWVYTGKVNLKTMLATGTFKSALGSYKGKFQCTFVESAPADSKSTDRPEKGTSMGKEKPARR